ncbi:MAG: UDP-N-acetylmuramate dehydrogenase [Bacteroidia bacterium]|nr:UDP-N-acetylmuramate dehydrogenase [Bacteroidia bacterium]
MKIFDNFNLKELNTFHISVNAKKLVVIESENELPQIQSIIKNNKYLILGGGSNVLFVNDFDGIIIKNEITGKEIIKETDEEIFLKIKSGEIWHDIVMWTVNNNWNGIENLSLIPGTAGAAPVQNIGAYGVEIKDVLEEVKIFHLETQSFQVLKNQECRFSYRDSIFKHELKDKTFITEIVLKLKKKNHVYKTDYGNIKEELSQLNVTTLSPEKIAQAVIRIRTSKLPDPAIIGNAGSFFKNPEVSSKKYLEIKNKYPDVVAFPLSNHTYKIAAGWMIEKLGLKGLEYKGAAVHSKQALVLINKNNATGKDLFDLSEIIINKIFDNFGILLEREVNIIT